MSRPVSHNMKLQEFIPDAGTSIRLCDLFCKRARSAKNLVATPMQLVSGSTGVLWESRTVLGRLSLDALSTLFKGPGTYPTFYYSGAHGAVD
ncbi:hypothetical protein JCGZ_13824 [Jatropha curcas]|uniref:Uncharacterized protein n=1 Tax=Jatropha curcas TaxID=180498 RepID=A0A067K825_JATCU|nr:hypothetical protein JCGZ_13824 [Jatropha curcas]